MKRLGDVARFFKGKGLPKSALVLGGAQPCIHYGELFTQYGERIMRTLSQTDWVDGCVFSEEGDVLMPTSDVTPRGLAKASCILSGGVVVGGDILIIRLDKSIDGTFLSYIIRYQEEQVLSLVTGSTVYHLYASDMKNFKFYAPPTIEEQKAIVEVLSDVDDELAALEARRDKACQLKQGMMQELLTGRIRLTNQGA